MAMSIKKIAGDTSVHYIPPRRKRGRGKPKMQPPLTPMIDVTFQLLLFFLLTFQFREREGQIPGSLPNTGQGGQADQVELLVPIRISLRPVNQTATRVIYEVEGYGQAFESAEELGTVLLRQARSNNDQGKKRPIIINCRSDVPWRYVVEAFNQSVRAKFETVGFATSLTQT